MMAVKPDNPGNFGKYKLKNAKALQKKVDAYFIAQDNHVTTALVGTGPNAMVRSFPDPQPYTWTGLARAIGLSGRQAILNYMDRDEFAPILREARMRIEEQWEAKLHRLGNNNGIMFALMNNTSPENGQWDNKVTQTVNMGGQAGNPIEIKHNVDDLTEDQLKAIEAVLIRK